jgi:phosphinothricin acetyltransferase
MAYVFEAMAECHRSAVMRIFNYFVEHSFAAFPDTASPYSFFDRMLEMAREYSALVVRDGPEVVGFGLLREYQPFAVFKRSAELSYFILPEHTGKGLGSTFLQRFLCTAKSMGVDRLLARVSSQNQQSLRFHERRGFVECGRMPEVGRKFGQDFDVVWFVMKI